MKTFSFNLAQGPFLTSNWVSWDSSAYAAVFADEPVDIPRAITDITKSSSPGSFGE